ncbi:Tubulin-specific chaperone E [Paramyrothecium foliicola]|nr:Tubulin-specific chaperone E [Paramyrothecium foliicola]
MSTSHRLGQRISYDGVPCTVRYVGEVAGTSGVWLGVEWDDGTRGKHDGCHKGTRYFSCLSKLPTAASFVRPTRPADRPQSFIGALNEKYASDVDAAPGPQIVISGKVAEEMGFDKIRRKLAQVRDLKVVIVDGLRVACAVAGDEAPVRDTCPNIRQLDLSRNLLESIEPVIDICSELPSLQNLALSGNRFRNVASDVLRERGQSAFRGVMELALKETLLSWEELSSIASSCPSLATFNVGLNQLSMLPPVDYSSLSQTLTSLNLEFNEFTALSDLRSLTALQSLRSLHLKGNSITEVASPGTAAPIFPPSLQYLDISYNMVENWSFVDSLPLHIPGIRSLRLAHNPVYEKQAVDEKTSSSEEAHMFTVARVAPLTSLNFSQITPADRTNAEMFYLSRIAKELASVSEAAETSVLAKHPRYEELCGIYGQPDIIRRQEINPSFLEARLITVAFHQGGQEKRIRKIPKSLDIYAVKGVAGKLFGLSPLKVSLIWETGEWDPVAGYDEKDGDSSDDDLPTSTLETDARPPGDGEGAADKPGRWIRREVQLKDGPRQLGYCVDGLDVTIRVENR